MVETGVSRVVDVLFGREPSDPDARARFDVALIATVLSLGGLFELANVLLRPASAGISVVTSIWQVVAAIGLFRKNRAGYSLAIVFSIVTAVLLSAPLVGYPLLLLRTLYGGDQAPTAAADAVLACCAIAPIALAIVAVADWWSFQKRMRALALQLRPALRALAFVGALTLVASLIWSPSTVLESMVLGPSAAPAWLSAVVAVGLVPAVAYSFWSYSVLRSTAVQAMMEPAAANVTPDGA